MDEIIRALYAAVSFEVGERPNWELQSEIFAPDARLVRVNDQGVFEMNPRTFREGLEGMIDSGTLASFWEGEVSREVREFGDIAQVLSVYETRASRDGAVINRAIKSIQLFKRDGRWWISAMIWRRPVSDDQLALINESNASPKYNS